MSFARKPYPKQPRSPLVLNAEPARATISRAEGSSPAVGKDKPFRSEAYKRLVASYPCINCGIEGYSQCAHSNQGRGLGQKASDLDTFPLCATRPSELGCHAKHDRLIGMTLEERRERESRYIHQTHMHVIQDSWDNWRVRKLLFEIGLVK